MFRGLAGGLAAVASAVGLSRPAEANAEAESAALGAVLAKTKSIPLRGGKIIKGKYVVTQPKKGVYRCFTAKCTHQGCAVAKISGGKIHCPCHGSQFSITDGRVLQGPATRALAKKKIKISKGIIRLA
jgi:Rieske Fe-S protein